jgi:hypothetical protein
MHEKYLGDSYNLGKQFFCQILGSVDSNLAFLS